MGSTMTAPKYFRLNCNCDHNNSDQAEW